MTITAPNLQQQIVLPGPEAGPWCLFECLPKLWREFKGIMESTGVFCFIPTVRENCRKGTKDCREEVPLWEGYGFCRGGQKVRQFADDTGRLASISPAWSAHLDKELQNIVNVINSGASLSKGRFVAGKMVIVARGPLACGDIIRGKIMDAHDGRLYIAAGGLWASCEVDAADCDPIQ